MNQTVYRIWSKVAPFSLFLRDLFYWFYNFFSRHHLVAMLTLTWITIRATIKAVTVLFNLIYRICQQSGALVTSSQANSTGVSWLTAFDCVNAIFPVFELFFFLNALMGLKGALWVLNWIRYTYKQIPLKGTS